MLARCVLFSVPRREVAGRAYWRLILLGRRRISMNSHTQQPEGGMPLGVARGVPAPSLSGIGSFPLLYLCVSHRTYATLIYLAIDIDDCCLGTRALPPSSTACRKSKRCARCWAWGRRNRLTPIPQNNSCRSPSDRSRGSGSKCWPRWQCWACNASSSIAAASCVDALSHRHAQRRERGSGEHSQFSEPAKASGSFGAGPWGVSAEVEGWR